MTASSAVLNSCVSGRFVVVFKAILLAGRQLQMVTGEGFLSAFQRERRRLDNGEMAPNRAFQWPDPVGRESLACCWGNVVGVNVMPQGLILLPSLSRRDDILVILRDDFEDAREFCHGWRALAVQIQQPRRFVG